MHFLTALGPGFLILLALLLFVVPFIDLPLSLSLQAAPSSEKRLRLYRLAIIELWLLAALAWACRNGMATRVPHSTGEAQWLFGAQWRTWGVALLVALFLAAALKPGIDCLLRPRRVPAYTRAMKAIGWFLPHDREQRRWFACLSVTAGICEEWVLRGVVPHGLHAKAGLSLTAALVISSLLFGWNHLYQGWKAIGSTALVGFALGLVALVSGGLLIPILLHCAMDLQLVICFRPDELPQDPVRPQMNR
jgi:membrane protease YdiL (CAAX protease family)